MIDLRQKLLMDLFREFREPKAGVTNPNLTDLLERYKNFNIGKIYKTVDRYIELGYTENIIDYYTKLNLVSLEERAYQRKKDDRNKKIIEQRKKNLKFIEENKLVEHPKFKGFYGTTEGRVFSSKAALGAIRELKPIYQKHNNGYYMLHLLIDNKRIQISWHVFIAQIFIPNPQNLPEVNHLDEDKGNCGVDNLEWSTRLDNVRHSSHSWGKNYIVENLKTGEIYEIVNLSKWCKDNEVDRHSAYEVINGIRQTVKKKTFKIYKQS